MSRSTSRWARPEWIRDLWWAVPLSLIGVAVMALVINSLIPYRPLDLQNYQVKPDTVCAGGDVTAYVTRAYTAEFDSLELEEAWVTERVAGYPPGRPVQSSEGTLPPQSLKPTNGPETVRSPLLTEAPQQPGTYRVRITAELHGWRFGLLPSVGEFVYYSSGTVTVRGCPGSRGR